eukprot:COSAG02_NODE_699_length_18369_cov_9.690203_12_plen_1083_part_00
MEGGEANAERAEREAPAVRLEVAEPAEPVARRPPPPLPPPPALPAPPPAEAAVLLQPDSSDGEASEEDEEEEADAIEGELQLGSAVAPFAIARFGASSARLNGTAVRTEPLRADAELANSAEISGCVAVIERGTCSFVQKARRAQAAGAIGVLFVNTDEELFIIGGDDGDDDIELPVVMVRASDGQAFLRELDAGPTTVSFGFVWSSSDEEDSDDEGGGIFATWGAATNVVEEPLDRDDMLKQIRLAAGWHSLKPVPEEIKQRGAKRELGARDLLMLSLKSGKELLQKVEREGELTPRAEREMRLAAAQTPVQTKHIVTAMSTRRLKVTVDSESDGESTSDWSEEEDARQDEIRTPPVPVISSAPARDAAWSSTQSLVSPSAETPALESNHSDGDDEGKLASLAEPEPESALSPAVSAIPKTHSLMTDEWGESQSSSRTRESSFSVGDSSLGSATSRGSSTANSMGTASDACLFVTLADGQTLQVERPDTDHAWERLAHDLQEATGADPGADNAPACSLVFLKPDGSRQCASDARSAKDLPDGAFVNLQIGSVAAAPLESSEWQIELPTLSPQQPTRRHAPTVAPVDPRQVAASIAFGAAAEEAASASPRMSIRTAAEVTTPGRGRRATRGGVTPRRVVAGMSAADALEADLCQAAAMQNATSKQLLSVCAESGSGWQEKYGVSSDNDAEGRQLRVAREELARRTAQLVDAWQPRIRKAKATAGECSDRHAALAVEGEFARAVAALDGLREEIAGIASATERSLSAEPPALALLEWWASHTDACHTAYRGFLHVDDAVEGCVENLASDARLTLATTVDEIRSALAMQHTQAATAAQLSLDGSLAAAAAVADGSHGVEAYEGGTPTVQRGSAIGSRALLPAALTVKEQKRSRLARRVLLARRERARYLAGLQAAGGAAAASVENLDPRGRHATASFRASLVPPPETGPMVAGVAPPFPAASAHVGVTANSAQLSPPPPPPRPGARFNVLDTTGDSGMLLRALALDGSDLDVLREWHTFPELKLILMQRFAVVDSVGLDAFFGKFCDQSFSIICKRHPDWLRNSVRHNRRLWSRRLRRSWRICA